MSENLRGKIQIFLQKFQKNNIFLKFEVFIRENTIYVILEDMILKFKPKLQIEIEKFIKNHSTDLQLKIICTNSNNKQQLSREKITIAKKSILVTSCKGGVGKSTISSLIAQQLAYIFPEKNIGLFDADIYGPSIHQIFNIQNSNFTINDNKITPRLTHGVHVLSLGSLIGNSTALALRAPIANKTLFKLLSVNNWGDDLDYLIIDSPPGTGDMHLSILQNYQIDKAVVITTPQKISIIDTARTIELLQKFAITIASLIENMSYLELPNQIIQLFHGGHSEELCNKYKIANLKKFPIITKLSEFCDQGTSLVEFFPLLDLKKLDVIF